MSYHVRKIPKGKLGEFSKIQEEFLEAKDAVEQENPVMALQECSDLIGAIEAYAANYNVTLTDLITMKEVTERVFKSGHRKPSK